MNIRGRVHNGVVVLDGAPELPEGAVVTVFFPIAPSLESIPQQRRIHLPLIASQEPGVKRLTPEHIAELLDDDDVPS